MWIAPAVERQIGVMVRVRRQVGKAHLGSVSHRLTGGAPGKHEAGVIHDRHAVELDSVRRHTLPYLGSSRDEGGPIRGSRDGLFEGSAIGGKLV
jgi:hypothetical protein